MNHLFIHTDPNQFYTELDRGALLGKSEPKDFGYIKKGKSMI